MQEEHDSKEALQARPSSRGRTHAGHAATENKLQSAHQRVGSQPATLAKQRSEDRET